VRFLGFVGPTYTLSSVNVDCQRCINLYPEVNELGTGKDREVASFLSAPGLKSLATIGSGPHRGAWVTSTGRYFVVSGNTLYEISSSYVPTSRGTLVTSTGTVSMADNGLQLVLVDGPNGYALTLATNSYAQISDPNFIGATKVLALDGYFIFNSPTAPQFYLSDLEAITFSGDLSPLQTNIGSLLTTAVDHRNLWLFGPNAIDVFYNSGAANFPFEYIQGSHMDIGCAAKDSVTNLYGTLLWLGQDKNGQGIVYQAAGFQPQRISTLSVEEALRSYSSISDATAWTYQDAGHSFYVLNFPTANATWVFDMQTKLWHERAYLSSGVLQRHRAQTHVLFNQKHIVGDYANGKIYELSRSYFDDDGNPMPKIRRSPHVSSDMVRQFFSQFELDFEAGVGLDGTTQGTNPQVILRWSDDGGHSWSNEHWGSLGKIGQTRWRAQWQRLGSARSRVFEISVSDPVKVVILGAELNYSAGVS
jgi:hypothetical protein